MTLAKIQKYGNSKMIVIDSRYVEAFDWKVGQIIDIDWMKVLKDTEEIGKLPKFKEEEPWNTKSEQD